MKNLKRKLELYEQLFRMFGPGESRCQVGQLASLWHVTERYVFTLLRTMEESGWISWQASSGRNKHASLECRVEPMEACYEAAEQLAQHGQVDELLKALSFGGRDAGKELQVFLNSANPRAQQVVYIPFHRAIESLHPHQVLRRTERFLVMQTYQRLTAVVNNKLEGDLAYHWESNSNGTVWTFQVRNNIQFHDGHSLSMQDIVRSLEGLVAHRYWAGCYQHVESIRAIANNVIEVKLYQTDWHLPRMFAKAEASVFRFGASLNPVGSGAFSLDVFSTNMLRLNSNPLYSHRVSIIDRVEIWFYPDWAVSKQCSHNQLRLQMPENTITLDSDFPATFMLLSNPLLPKESRIVAVEDTSDAQQLFAQTAQQGDSAFKIDYGDYHATKDALLCSIIEEDDYYTAWLSLFLRFPFKALNLADDMLVAIQSRLEAIRSEPDVEKSLSLLNELRTWLHEQQIMTELKQENFRLEVSERLKGSVVDGFGWCQLNELWINQG